MKREATLFHDGRGGRCGLADTSIGLVVPKALDLEAVGLGRDRGRVAKAEAAGVAVLPPLAVGGRVPPAAPHPDLDRLERKRPAAA